MCNMLATMKQKFHWKGLTYAIEKSIKNYKICEEFKKTKHKYGKLPLKDMSIEIIPWNQV